MRIFLKLKQYKKQHGDSNVLQNQGQLGTWVNDQRRSYKRGKLSQERFEQLKSIGFEWVLRESHGQRTTDWHWRMTFVDLVDYLMEHGTCNVPQSQGSLGNWVSYQRQSYKDGRLSQYQYRIDYLDSIGFAWELKRGDKSHPDKSIPNLKTIACMIKEEKGTPIARALEAYLDRLPTN